MYRAIIDKYAKIAPRTAVDGRRLDGFDLREGEVYKTYESGITVIAKGAELK